MTVRSALTKLQHHWKPAVLLVGGLIVVLLVLILLKRRAARRLRPEDFRKQWQELQKQCATKATWPLAIIDADQLLDDALKRCHYKGKTMGERLVAAQHELSDNESIWMSHKLRNKLVHENYKLTRKNEVKAALIGYLQALKDLGALKHDK